MLTHYGRFMREPRMRPQEFVVCCVFCGEVIALTMGGQRIPDAIHECPPEDKKGEQA